MLKSCLTVIVVIVVAGFAYNMYRKSLEPESPALAGEHSPQFKRTVFAAFEDYISQNPNISRLTLDGSIMDLHYVNNVAKNQFRIDASEAAESFSRIKLRALDNGDVIVRCIFQNLIQVEVVAENGRVMQITEL